MKKIKIKRGVLISSYLAMILTFILVLVIPGIKWSSSAGEKDQEFYLDLSDGWVYEDGSPASLYGFNRVGTSEFDIYHDIPEELPYGTSLCFLSRNVYTDLYINGEAAEIIERKDYPFYTKSPATLWHFVNIPESAYGSRIKIHIQNVYNKNCTSLNDIALSNSEYYILKFIRSKLLVIGVCALMFFAGLLFMIVDLYALRKIKKDPDIFYLGMFAFLVAMWSLSETRILNLFTDDSRLLQIFKLYMLAFIPLPMVYYLKKYFKIGQSKAVSAIILSIILSFFIVTGLASARIYDLEESIILVHLNLIYVILLILYSAVKTLKLGFSHIKFSGVLYITGFIVIIVTCSIDLYRFYFGKGNTDAALFVRLGLLMAIICYGTAGMKNVIDKVNLGMKSDFISKLAYEDGLTGVGNRTAYQEKIEDYGERKNFAFGIVMFDVNNLKHVNDVLGHKYGDELITDSAEIIKTAFAGMGKCYRIGGDEFSVFIKGGDIEAKYNEGIETLVRLQKEANEGKSPECHVSIAYGMAVYDSRENDDITEVCELADKRMYECKKKIKSEHKNMIPEAVRTQA